MAESFVEADREEEEAPSLHKTAHEMSIDGDEPPPRYILLTSLFSPPPEQLHKLRSTLSSWGCFQGMVFQIHTLTRYGNVAKQFFSLPVEEKKKYSRAEKDGEGHGGDLIVSHKQVLDWSDRLALKVLPEDQRRLNLWPESPAHFREITHEYSLKVKCVLDILFKAIAKSLNLEEDSFLNQFGQRAQLIARFNFYPPCPRPEQVLGLKPHSDKSGVTVLLQDKEVEGLHVLKDDQWFRVPIVPHALVVNVGDQMQIMTNGIIKSPVHRAVTNPEKLRISVAVSNEPEPEKEIGPEEGLIDEKRPRLYRNVKNYAAVNFECFQKGEVAIETVKV
ncbi:hypothetical protein HYC85_026017 [Camellia sinensis]|uniref:Fe2OG dioxygenase domain-containing protein n=1 Tax=Camellia sinensis TaxID=4442 RepID=A0A7J7G5M2_CAMSI|nr:hypothetical protein HYC85_026017 [Camellia sinensis]